MKFMVIVWPAFFERVKPVSTSAKPACMNITRNPATSVHTKLIDVEFAAVCVTTESTLAFKVVCAISATGEASRPTASAEFLINTFTVLLQGYGGWVGYKNKKPPHFIDRNARALEIELWL